MNKTLVLALMTLSASFAAYSYTVDVDRSGIASATLSLEGGETVNVSLPADASNFRIVGGEYRTAENAAIVSAGPSGLATFSYSTSLFTVKTDSGWKLAFSPPEGAEIRIYAPPYATIEGSYPQPKSVSSEDSRLVIISPGSKQVTVYYRLDEPPPGAKSPDLLLPALAVLAALIILAAYLQRPRPGPASASSLPKPPPTTETTAAGAEKAPGLDLTEGKKAMMETFNENDLKIVRHLLGCGGKCRRNELERKSGISKSSLAMALNRLEKRKMLEIDRTSTTHFIRLSDHFLRL